MYFSVLNELNGIYKSFSTLFLVCKLIDLINNEIIVITLICGVSGGDQSPPRRCDSILIEEEGGGKRGRGEA